jgi:hypothetical protein
MTLSFKMTRHVNEPLLRSVYIRNVIVFIAGTMVACTPTTRDFPSSGSGNVAGSGGTAGMGGAGGIGGTGGAEPIPCPVNTHRCAVPSPEGWSAPSAIVEGVPSPDCPSDYPNLLVDAHDDVFGAPAKCNCACGPSDVTCGNIILFYRQACNAPAGPDGLSGPFDTCLKSTAKQSGVGSFFAEQGLDCPPKPSMTIEPPTSQSAYRACGTNQVDGVCDNGLVCIPEIVAPYRLCVTRDGDFPCPPGYLDRSLHYKGTKDTRACTDCTCTPMPSGRCESTVQGYSDIDCKTASGSPIISGKDWPDAQCVPIFGYYTYSKPVVIEPGSCTPAIVDPIGTTELADPVTFCCAMP